MDQKILEAISEGATKFSEICAYCDQHQGSRLIDKRLQALRRKGAIRFDSKRGWSITGTGKP